MTVDRDSVLQAIRELYAEEDRWFFAKDVAVRMGLKGSGPIAKVVRKELESLAKDGVIDTEAESGFGRRFKAREGPPAEAVEDEPEQEQEPRRRGGRAPVAVRRCLAALSERPRRLLFLKSAGVDPKTVRRCVVDGWVEDAGADGYAITQAGRERLAEIDEAYPELSAPLNCAQGPSPDPANCGPEPAEPQPTEDKAEAKAEVPEPVPVPEPEPEPEPPMNPLSKLSAGIPEPEPEEWFDEDDQLIPDYVKVEGVDSEPDEPPIGEAVNAVVLEVAVVYRISLRTAEGPASVEVRKEDLRDVLGPLGTYGAEGRAVRIRDNGGRVQIGHIVDEEWRWAL